MVKGSWLRVHCLGFMVQGLGFRVLDFESRVYCFVLRVWGFAFKVESVPELGEQDIERLGKRVEGIRV